ncbi:MAG TPA: TetR/AcrR family transcriptional regulator [Gaiellaceae bacterium]|nr:TetR/AcrR family transcriptional regulator [Gaiellaceae bacterium]
MGELLTTPSETSGRRRRSDGERSRAAILDAATQLATVEGLDGLSIGRLAEHTGMSKSGLYAHFGSKEELQLATIDAAAAIFTREVIEPARTSEGAARLQALADAFLSYLERRVFPGGCFFAAAQAELDTHPGPVREKLRETGYRWHGYIERQVRRAQETGELDPDEDPAQLAFELDAMLKMATAVFVLQDDPKALERARRGVEARLERAKIGA